MERAQCEQLARALKITPRFLIDWLKQHAFTADSVTLDQINRLLVKAARGFETPPTIDDYLKGNVRLLSPDEALKLFGARDLDKRQFSQLRVQFPTVVLGSAYRFETFGVYRILNHLLSTFTINIVKSLVGSPAAFSALTKNGLRPINSPGKVYDRKDVCRALAQIKILPPWIAPDEWVTVRLQTIRSPLLLLPEVTALYRVTPAKVEQWRQSRQVWYITHQGVTRYLSSTIPRIAEPH